MCEIIKTQCLFDVVSATDCFNRLWNNNHTRTGRLVCSVNSVNSVNRTTPVWQQRLHTKKTHLETMSSLSSGLPVGNEPILCCPCVNIYSKYLYKYEENLLKETGCMNCFSTWTSNKRFEERRETAAEVVTPGRWSSGSELDSFFSRS